MNRFRAVILLAGAFLAPWASGCNPFSMGIFTPIPVPPWVGYQIESKLENNSDFNTVILAPIPPGYRPLCEDPPDRATILRAMPPVIRGVPYFLEEFRDDVEFSVERLVDEIDPPRFFPLVGPAQLHHCHYKCTIFYTETIQMDQPFGWQVKKRRVEVVYIDRDHLHTVACTPEQRQSMSHDLNQYQP